LAQFSRVDFLKVQLSSSLKIGGKFEENLYDTPHDSLVVTGAFGHGLIRDIVFGSKKEKSNQPSQTTC